MVITGQTYTNNFISEINIWHKFYLGQNYFYIHPYKRKLLEQQIIWQKGSAKLITYSKKKNKPTILLIPSLINKSYIFDLKENLSLVRYLDRDFNVILLDWSNPDLSELEFGISDYIIQRIVPAILFIKKSYGDIFVLGYCLGGLMAMASCFFSDHILSLILIATPWDFNILKNFNYYANKDIVVKNNSYQYLKQDFDEQYHQKIIPSHVIQNWFCQYNFNKIFNKFTKFCDEDQNSEKAENFVAIEQWLRNGIDITRKVVNQLFEEFIDNNVTLNNSWQIQSQIIDPSKLRIPTLIVMPSMDNIVPLSSTQILTKKIPNNNQIIMPSGHIGMIIGSKAKDYLWKNLKNWMIGRSLNLF